MVKRCVVVGCIGTYVPFVRSIHTIPTNPSVSKKWVAFVKIWRADWKPSPSSQICSDHFVPQDFKNYYQFASGYAEKLLLKPGAVPSVQPPREVIEHLRNRQTHGSYGSAESINQTKKGASSRDVTSKLGLARRELLDLLDGKTLPKDSIWAMYQTHTPVKKSKSLLPLMGELKPNCNQPQVKTEPGHARNTEVLSGMNAVFQVKTEAGFIKHVGALDVRNGGTSDSTPLIYQNIKMEPHSDFLPVQNTMIVITRKLETEASVSQFPATLKAGPKRLLMKPAQTETNRDGICECKEINLQNISTRGQLALLEILPHRQQDILTKTQLNQGSNTNESINKLKPQLKSVQCNGRSNDNTIVPIKGPWKLKEAFVKLERIKVDDKLFFASEQSNKVEVLSTKDKGIFCDSDDHAYQTDSSVDDFFLSDSDEDVYQKYNDDDYIPSDVDTDEYDTTTDEEEDEKDCDKKKTCKPYSKPQRCQQCGRCFSSIQALENHKKDHEENVLIHDCIYCKKSFKTPEECSRHQEYHKCKYCGKVFKNISVRWGHEQDIHIKEPTFMCYYCGKLFVTAQNRDAHEKIHTGKKPFKCSFCSKTFIFSNHLNRHEKTHTGEKVHLCQFCGKSFVQKSNRDNHERVHTGETPYQCRFCDKAFNHNVSRKAHEKKCTGKRLVAQSSE